MKRALYNLWYLSTTWLFGIVIGIIFEILKKFKKIKVLYPERFPRWRRRIIVVSNHPSLLEPLLLPALFFRQYLIHPLKYGPWSTPDRKNYYDRWYWFGARSRLIPIDRKNRGRGGRTLLRMKKVLDDRGIIIFFAEEGRTFKGQEFLYSKKGKRIRRITRAVAWLALKTGASILPVWVEGTERILPNHPQKLFVALRLGETATIKIGHLLGFRPTQRVGDAEKITQIISNALLNLADEE